MGWIWIPSTKPYWRRLNSSAALWTSRTAICHTAAPRLIRFPIGDREQCFEKCASQGYPYAGLQWKGECWCGHSYGKYGKADPSKCNCERGSKDFGFWHQCIYQVAETASMLEEALPVPEAPVAADDGPKFVGCYKDNKKRDMPRKKQNFKLGERENCFDKCREEGFQFAGLQWKGQCFCGNSYGSYGEGENCDCSVGSKNFGKWEQCIYELTPKADAACDKNAELNQLVQNGESAWLDGLVSSGEISDAQRDWIVELFQNNSPMDSSSKDSADPTKGSARPGAPRSLSSLMV